MTVGTFKAILTIALALGAAAIAFLVTVLVITAPQPAYLVQVRGVMAFSEEGLDSRAPTEAVAARWPDARDEAWPVVQTPVPRWASTLVGVEMNQQAPEPIGGALAGGAAGAIATRVVRTTRADPGIPEQELCQRHRLRTVWSGRRWNCR